MIVPLGMSGEKFLFRETEVFAVSSSIEVKAPASEVWKNVIAFAEIPEPTEWYFRTGLAYPIRAHIDGRGAGAVRHCVFSTGEFTEPIQIWNEPHLLQFSVSANPPPMEEMTFYSKIHPPASYELLHFAPGGIPVGRNQSKSYPGRGHNVVSTPHAAGKILETLVRLDHPQDPHARAAAHSKTNRTEIASCLMRFYVSAIGVNMNKTNRIILCALVFLCICPVAFSQQRWAGTYVTMIGDADVPPDMKAAVGRWELILSDEGTFTTAQNGEVVVRGSYVVSADQMSFSDSEGKMACPEQSTGTYKPALNGATLTFTLVEDDCAGRRIVLLSHPLTKQKQD